MINGIFHILTRSQKLRRRLSSSFSRSRFPFICRPLWISCHVVNYISSLWGWHISSLSVHEPLWLHWVCIFFHQYLLLIEVLEFWLSTQLGDYSIIFDCFQNEWLFDSNWWNVPFIRSDLLLGPILLWCQHLLRNSFFLNRISLFEYCFPWISTLLLTSLQLLRTVSFYFLLVLLI